MQRFDNIQGEFPRGGISTQIRYAVTQDGLLTAISEQDLQNYPTEHSFSWHPFPSRTASPTCKQATCHLSRWQ